ncbi:hypothetical protein BGX34_007735 [Mortierella sp. NVP85]|nr:hypothetical protein BGX34_007735 [Mortierella sp. NVP85]
MVQDCVKFNTIEEAISDIAAGKFVIAVDNEDRENEGDLIIAAEKITTEQMAFLIKHSRDPFGCPDHFGGSSQIWIHEDFSRISVLGSWVEFYT